jgi:hypothetical protein
MSVPEAQDEVNLPSLDSKLPCSNVAFLSLQFEGSFTSLAELIANCFMANTPVSVYNLSFYTTHSDPQNAIDTVKALCTQMHSTFSLKSMHYRQEKQASQDLWEFSAFLTSDLKTESVEKFLLDKAQTNIDAFEGRFSLVSWDILPRRGTQWSVEPSEAPQASDQPNQKRKGHIFKHTHSWRKTVEQASTPTEGRSPAADSSTVRAPTETDPKSEP